MPSDWLNLKPVAKSRPKRTKMQKRKRMIVESELKQTITPTETSNSLLQHKIVARGRWVWWTQIKSRSMCQGHRWTSSLDSPTTCCSISCREIFQQSNALSHPAMNYNSFTRPLIDQKRAWIVSEAKPVTKCGTRSPAIRTASIALVQLTRLKSFSNLLATPKEYRQILRSTRRSVSVKICSTPSRQVPLSARRIFANSTRSENHSSS